MNCPSALTRLKIGVPATIEHAVASSSSASGSGSGADSKLSAKNVAEVVQLFITLMDSLKLNMVAADTLHPLLSDLMQALNKVMAFDAAHNEDALSKGREKLKDWLVTLNRMKASEELSEDQTRQLIFDLESTHNAFYRSLSDK